jgi:acyl-CoA thioesterase-1
LPESPNRRKIGGVSSRRRAALLLVALLLIGAAWALWPRAERRSPRAAAPPAGSTVVFLGDSITHGHRLPGSAAFPHRLGQALGVQTINAGISGDTTDGGLRRIEQDVLAHRPGVVVVGLGVNDAFGQQPRETVARNLRAIAQRSRTAGARVILLHMAVPGLAGDGYREDLREIARAEGATLVEDFLDGVVPAHTYDRLHPDEQGQAMLAERLLPVVRQALGRP